jgi:N-dimethylarginine dimethylaminohydrolase
MCFTANAGLVHGNAFIGSRFLHAERRGEEEHFRDWFAGRGYACAALAGNVVFEGAGDALHDASGRIWMGYGQRSSFGAVQALRDSLAVEVVALQLVDPRFYHLDTCFCPLRAGGVVYFPGAFSARSLATIEERFAPAERIVVSESDATALACNIVDLGHVVVLTRASETLRAAFARRGIGVREVDLSEFIKSGGAAKCLVLPLPAMTESMLRGARSTASMAEAH